MALALVLACHPDGKANANAKANAHISFSFTSYLR